MKKVLLLGLAICLSLGAIACSKTTTENEKKQITKQEEIKEEKGLTEEELKEIDEQHQNDINKNTKYKFAQIKNVNDTKIDVEFVNTPQGYPDKGYNEDLDIDTSSFKLTGETGTIDIIGVSTNFVDIEDLKEGKFVRIGIYETESESSESVLENGSIMSVDII